MSKALEKPGRSPAEPASDIDEMDFQIIALLREDGRMSNRDMARELGITEATVRARLRRLEERQTLRVVAMADFGVPGHSLMTAVGVQVKGRSAAEVAADLAALPQVLTVNIVIGAHDIEIAIVSKDQQELATFLNHTLANLPGVFRLTPGLALDILKYRSDWVPFP